MGVCAVPPVNGVMRYPVIGLPPSVAGMVQLSATWPSPRVPVTPAGGPGTVLGVTGSDAAESGPVPAALIAATRKVYAVPFCSRPIVREVSVVLVTIAVWGVPPTYGVIR